MNTCVTFPFVFGNGDWGPGGNGLDSTTDVHNASLEENFTVSPNIVWTNRFALDRAVAPVTENYPKLSTVFDQPGDAVLGHPNTERNNLVQFTNFTGDSGIAVPINVVDPNTGTTLLNHSGNLPGVTNFPTSGHRNIPVDRNNWAPRVGFAYSLDSKTVLRGGAGIYYGLNIATNYQSPGPAFGNSNPIRFTTDNFQTRLATLADPFPGGFAAPQGDKYGTLAMWGFNDNNTLGTTPARNAERWVSA